MKEGEKLWQVVRKERKNKDDKILEGAAQRTREKNVYFLFGIWLTV